VISDVPISPPARREILGFARSVVACALRGEPVGEPYPTWQCYSLLQRCCGVFVTMEKGAQLRGCIGELGDRFPLHRGIRVCAVKAALEDPRFPPVTAPELSVLTFSVSILSRPQPIQARGLERAAVLVPHRDGVILEVGRRRSTFLPRVWQQYENPQDFLSQLCVKQGASPDCWTDPEVRLLQYETTDLKESSPQD